MRPTGIRLEYRLEGLPKIYDGSFVIKRQVVTCTWLWRCRGLGCRLDNSCAFGGLGVSAHVLKQRVHAHDGSKMEGRVSESEILKEPS